MGSSKDIREAVEDELTFDPLVDASNVTVKNINGDVALTGTVRYGSERSAAELAVGGLIGLRNIKDEIGIEADSADPDTVTALVQAALDRNALIRDDSDVQIDTTGSTVTLSGHVRTWAEHDAVVDATWMADGVDEVDDNLIITG